MDCPPLPADWLEHPSLGLRAAAAEHPDCVREQLAALGLDSAGVLGDIPAAPPLPFKDVRDGYGVPTSVESDNFVVRWGTGVDDAAAQGLLEDLEAAWSVEVDELGFPLPRGTDSWKLNVYVGDTGGNTPTDFGAAGYYAVDDEGHPMLVVSLDTAQDVDGRRHITTAHEFFHAIQDSTGSYAFGTGERGSWWWESTAVWVNLLVHPDNPGAADYLLGWTFFPHLSVDHFVYPDGLSLEPYHAYGAFLFVEALDDAELVRRSWVEPTSDDPLETLDDLLWETGDSVDEVLLELWPRVVTWDLDPTYQQAHERDAERFPEDDKRITRVLGLDIWDGVDDELLPRDRGVNHLWVVPPEGTVVTDIRFEGEAQGSAGTAAEWTVLAVRDDETLTDPDEVHGDAPFMLVVAPFARVRVDDETFDYQVRADPKTRDCGCGVHGTSPPGGLALVLLWLTARAGWGRRARARTSAAS
ncbi:MAG: hypothetical protein GY913_31200 [Proteobacteria bacterium]|nr:hypothetical protein [Pseudomonadota bacterium]MCP4921386.1 hypothetical protein [Pseudomonadota bacterium]